MSVPRHAPGRHRAAPRHRRAPAGRTALLTASLGASLAVGVAGGTAAAAAQRHTPIPVAPLPAAAQRHTPIPVAPFPAAAIGSATASTADGTLANDRTGSAAGDRPLRVASTRSGAPVRQKPRPVTRPGKITAAWLNPNPTATVTSCFGPRWGHLHAGVDLAAPDRTPIVAAGAGVVVRAGVAAGYGNAVLIDHGDGYLTHYGHLSAITVTAGQHVTAGQQIGNEGSTGHSTGPHLHFEVHRGFYQNPIEPTAWMHAHGVDIQGCSIN